MFNRKIILKDVNGAKRVRLPAGCRPPADVSIISKPWDEHTTCHRSALYIQSYSRVQFLR